MQRTYIGDYYFDQERVAERYYGWISTQNLTPDLGQ